MRLLCVTSAVFSGQASVLSAHLFGEHNVGGSIVAFALAIALCIASYAFLDASKAGP